LTITEAQQFLVSLPFAGRVFLEGPAGTGKTAAAIYRLRQMLRQGIPGQSVLVLAPQRPLSEPYEAFLRRAEAGPGGRVTVWTPGSLAKQMVDLFWPLVAGPAGFGAPEAPPTFLNLETAQYTMAHLAEPLIEE
jgi:hypothetical protein